MKTRMIILIVTILVFIDCKNALMAQEKAGCDLCGPSSGTSQNNASGNYSATIGVASEARGIYSFAVGNAAKANAGNTLAMGKFVRATATNSVVIGSGTSNSDTRSLINNKPNTMMIGFNSIYPTLFITSSSAYNTTGKIGIGNITNPRSKLHIKSDSNEDAGIILEPTTVSSTAFLQIYDEHHRISVLKGKGMSILSENDNINMNAKNIVMTAKVGINTTNSFTQGYNYTLAVSGGILTNEVFVKEVSEWHDYVFEDNYDLKSLSELESFINSNGHLPDIPSEEKVLNEGYNMIEMDGLLLKKIEELTLYTIELNKIIEQQKLIIESLKSSK